MTCFCENQDSKIMKIEGDMSANPLWCRSCGCNLEIESLPISPMLKDEFMSWGNTYGSWIDWKNDALIESKLILEIIFNERGLELTEKLISELDNDYDIIYVPSNSKVEYT